MNYFVIPPNYDRSFPRRCKECWKDISCEYCLLQFLRDNIAPAKVTRGEEKELVEILRNLK